MSTTSQTPIYAYLPSETVLELMNAVPLNRVDNLKARSIDTLSSSPLPKGSAVTTVSEIPQLPAPQIPAAPSEKHETALDDFVKAFCAIFTTMAKGINSQVTQFNQLQTLDQTNSEIVVTSSNDAIEAEMSADTAQQKINDAQAEEAQQQADLGWMQWLGVGLGVVAILLSIPTGGASDAALAEDAGTEMTSLSSSGADISVSGADVAADQAAVQAGDEAVGEASSAESDAAAPQNNAASGNVNNSDNLNWFEKRIQDLKEICQAKGQEVIDTGSKLYNWAKEANAARAAGETWRDSLYMKLFNFIGSTCATAPSFLDSLAKQKIAEYQADLAEIQYDVAPKLGLVQENQMNFQFYQGLCKRQANVCQGNGDQLSDVLLIAGSIMKGYQQVPANLVNPA